MIKNQDQDETSSALNSGLFAINGQPQPKPWQIPITDRGFVYGQCALETMPAFRISGRDWIPHLDRHLARLESSCETLGFNLPTTTERIAVMIQSLVAACSSSGFTGSSRFTVRIYATPGSRLVPGSAPTGMESSLLPTGSATDGCWYALISPVQSGWMEDVRQLTRNGVTLAPTDLGYTRRNHLAKSTNYADAIAAIKVARKQGLDDILWINSDREIVETSTANIFFIGRLGDQVEIVTPSTRSGCLKGITATWLLELLNEAGIPASSSILQLDELPRFDEAFLTSSLRGLIPVTTIGRHKLHSCREESTFKQIRRLFDAGIARLAGERIDWITGQKGRAETSALF